MLQLHLVEKCTQRGTAKEMCPLREICRNQGRMLHREVKAAEVVLTTGSKLKTVMEKSKYNY